MGGREGRRSARWTWADFGAVSAAPQASCIGLGMISPRALGGQARTVPVVPGSQYFRLIFPSGWPFPPLLLGRYMLYAHWQFPLFLAFLLGTFLLSAWVVVTQILRPWFRVQEMHERTACLRWSLMSADCETFAARAGTSNLQAIEHGCCKDSRRSHGRVEEAVGSCLLPLSRAQCTFF